ncbi:hypothetical protein MXEN_15405 [Mycobacterium xenopi RIVM700367]|nr:hypothetical protein MXEN_15405 [Mycobacterium xenopi RIVM700367]
MVTTGGRGVVTHAGARLLAELADSLGPTAGLSAVMAATKTRRRGHDRGRVLTDLAIAIADGASAISDLRVLADQPDLFGQVASVPTAWRALGAVDESALARIAQARAQARAAAWAAGADPGWYVIDIDGVLVEADSAKQHAAPTYKHGFGFYPLLAVLDATGGGIGRAAAPRQRRLQHGQRPPQRFGCRAGPAAGATRPAAGDLPHRRRGHQPRIGRRLP